MSRSSKAPPNPPDPGRREVLRRLGTATALAAACGAAAYHLHDDKHPVRTPGGPDREIPDHRVEVPAATPSMIIARGPDPAANTRAALERLGVMGKLIQKGDLVVVKPNIGWDRRPEQAANTNPHVVAEVVRACVAAGAARVIVTDHPVNDPRRCFERSGISAAVEEAGGTIKVPGDRDFYMVSIPGKLGRWPVFEPFITATKVINIPVVKHHSLTQATLGVKNWYGILGGRRNQLHQRIDDSVAELALLMRPTLTVMDATRVLLRNGPTGGSLGDVKRMDSVAVSLDPVAVDAWGCTLLGAKPEEQGWLQLGQNKKLGVLDYRSLNPVEIKS